MKLPFTLHRTYSDAAWVTAVFGALQVLRFASNIILARLLSPAIFGVLTLITTLRTGIELITDVGVGQSVIVSKDGEDPDFISTAWAVQAIRGIVLFIIGLGAAWPIAWFYDKPSLGPAIAVASVIFVLTGFTLPSAFVMQRQRMVKRLALYQFTIQAASIAISLAFAWFWSSVWGMLAANIAAAVLASAGSFYALRLPGVHLKLVSRYAKAILTFGKWVFLSTLLYFVGANFDRLYLPSQIPLALFGVYGIAKSMSDAANALIDKLSSQIVLPAVARQADEIKTHFPRLKHMRTLAMLATSVALGGGIAVGDIFVGFAYDARYVAAALLLPMLLVGTWFSVHSTMGDYIVMGLSRPQSIAAGNAARLAWNMLLLPIAFARGDLLLGFIILGLADFARYAWLTFDQARCGLNLIWRDIGSLALMLATALIVRLLVVALGLSDGMVSSVQMEAFNHLLAAH